MMDRFAIEGLQIVFEDFIKYRFQLCNMIEVFLFPFNNFKFYINMFFLIEKSFPGLVIKEWWIYQNNIEIDKQTDPT